MKISNTELASARNYIEHQFATHSWWPKEPPEQAKHEFNLMQHDATALSVWCNNWLDSGQYKKLKSAIGPQS